MLQLSKITKSFLPPNSRKRFGLIIASAITIAGGILYLAHRPSTSDQLISKSVRPTQAVTVNALGRLEPQGEIIKMSASSEMGSGNTVVEVRVKEGDLVKARQVVAVLESRDRLQASLLEAQERVRVAQAKLAQVRVGAKRGEINARQAAVVNLKSQLNGEIQTQKATIARLVAERQNADSEFRRYQMLYLKGAISASVLDSRKLTLTTAIEQLKAAQASLERTQRTLMAQIQEAQSSLEQTAEVRPTDVNAALSEVNSAIATVKRSQAELNQAFIRAPSSGRILRVRTKAGETVGTNGIVELGQTDQMVAIAEVYESDIGKIRLGQTAIITSPSNVFSEQLHGMVKQIGSQIAKKDILNSDPTAATDARVIEVKIQLDEAASKKVANLINLQVNVEIRL